MVLEITKITLQSPSSLTITGKNHEARHSMDNKMASITEATQKNITFCTALICPTVPTAI